MKIRIKGNSLRYRLTKSDVKQLAENCDIEEVINFGNNALTYALQRSAADKLTVNFTGNKITVFIPDILVEEWITTDVVGFDDTYNNVYLLIEKDFMCLDIVAEDQSDNYPNPLNKSQF
jgi:hypothetical protein